MRKIIVSMVIISCLVGNQGNIASSIVENSVATSDELEEQKEKSTTPLGIRQDEVETLLSSFVSSIFTSSDQEEFDSKLDEMSEYCTDEELERLSTEVEINSSASSKVMESKVYYVSKENSGSGQYAKEYVDIKVGNSEENVMYLIEFMINDNGKIASHRIWEY